MAGNYASFTVEYEDADGVLHPVGAGVNVHVREDGALSDVAESPLTTDSSGQIAAGSIASLAAGGVVHFRVENYNGLSASIPKVLT